jgi:hypothetical protein
MYYYLKEALVLACEKGRETAGAETAVIDTIVVNKQSENVE